MLIAQIHFPQKNLATTGVRNQDSIKFFSEIWSQLFVEKTHQ